MYIYNHVYFVNVKTVNSGKSNLRGTERDMKWCQSNKQTKCSFGKGNVDILLGLAIRYVSYYLY